MNNSDHCLYLYCVSNQQPLTDTLEKLPYSIECVRSGNLVAMVGQVKINDFNEHNLTRNLSDIEWVNANVQRHEQVIEELMRTVTVVPSKFASIFFNKENVALFLSENTAMLEEKLIYFQHRQEWGVKVFCDLAALKQHVLKEDHTLLDLDQQIGVASAGKAYLLRKKKDALVDGIVEEKLNDYRKSFFEILGTFGVQSKINAPLSQQFTERNDQMILNAAFMIEVTAEAQFKKQIEALAAEFSIASFDFNCTGPWPPYNFC